MPTTRTSDSPTSSPNSPLSRSPAEEKSTLYYNTRSSESDSSEEEHSPLDKLVIDWYDEHFRRHTYKHKRALFLIEALLKEHEEAKLPHLPSNSIPTDQPSAALFRAAETYLQTTVDRTEQSPQLLAADLLTYGHNKQLYNAYAKKIKNDKNAADDERQLLENRKQACFTARTRITQRLSALDRESSADTLINNANQLIITATERLLIDKRVNKWFDAFVKATDQKERMAELVKALFSHLAEQSAAQSGSQHAFSPKHILDIGPGEGTFSKNLISVLRQLFPSATQELFFEGIELDPNFVKRTQEAVESITGVKSNVFHGNAFDAKELDKLGKDAQLILVANLLYYAKPEELKAFLRILTPKLDINSIFAFFHENAKGSQSNELREALKAPINTQTSVAIENEMLTEAPDIELLSIPLSSRLFFPKETRDMLDAISSHAKGVTKLKPDDKELFKTIKYLLEFLAQRPLETLAEELQNNEEKGTLLSFFLTQVERYLKHQGNQVKISTTAHIGISPESSIEFKTALKLAIATLRHSDLANPDYKPSTKVSEIHSFERNRSNSRAQSPTH